MTVMKRVALVDDHALVRAGLRALVEYQPGHVVVAEGSDGREVKDILESARPDILLLDINMKYLSGLQALQQIHAEFPGVQVLILSMHNTPDYILAALKFGARGYLLKDAAAQELDLALQALARDESYLSPGVAKTVIQSAITESSTHSKTPMAKLTPRQTEILRLIARGCSTKYIGQGLGISMKTVETHRAQIMNRLSLHDVPSLVLYAVREGLVSPED